MFFVGTVGELTMGALRKPLTAWKMPPPIAPMEKAPPQSSTILQGLHEEIKIQIKSFQMYPSERYINTEISNQIKQHVIKQNNDTITV